MTPSQVNDSNDVVSVHANAACSHQANSSQDGTPHARDKVGGDERGCTGAGAVKREGEVGNGRGKLCA